MWRRAQPSRPSVHMHRSHLPSTSNETGCGRRSSIYLSVVKHSRPSAMKSFSVEMGHLRSSRLIIAFIVLLTIFGGYLYAYRYYHRYYQSLPDDWPGINPGPTTMSMSNSSANKLEMELVIVPYLRYKASESAIQEREKEYMTVLKNNLNHNLVKKVHLLTTETRKTRLRLKTFGLSNHNKLLIVKVNSIEKMQDAFEYISHNLVGTDVMFLNADIYLGSGFENVDPVVMHNNKIMYSLTRHVKKEEDCGERYKCIGMKYVGSHDTFLFHLTEPIPESALKILDYNLSSRGMENVLMWMFRTRLKFCILNPCATLITYHLHCTNLRTLHSKKRVTNATTFGWAPFTDDLVCTCC